MGELTDNLRATPSFIFNFYFRRELEACHVNRADGNLRRSQRGD
jgi:hypothetical protein